MGGMIGSTRRLVAVVGPIVLVALWCVSSAAAHEVEGGRAGFKPCGTKELYDKTLEIRVTGKMRNCERVKQIVRGRCRDEKRWSCFSLRTPYPPLLWYRSRERFDRHRSTVIEARRYPCSEAALTSEQWTAESWPCPTRGVYGRASFYQG
jgi:hypothetical protein